MLIFTMWIKLAPYCDKGYETLLWNNCSLADIAALSWKIQCYWLKKLDFSLVFSVEISLDKCDAMFAGYPSCRPRFYVILYLETFYSFAQTKDNGQFCIILFLNNFLPDYAKNAYSQRGFRNVTYTTASLPTPMLTTKLPTMHFTMSNEW